jgi:hypothetical protein
MSSKSWKLRKEGVKGDLGFRLEKLGVGEHLVKEGKE